MKKPVCVGGHYIKDLQLYYTINPEGGYGLSEVLCCEDCIRKKKFKWLRQRMIDAGAKELRK